MAKLKTFLWTLTCPCIISKPTSTKRDIKKIIIYLKSNTFACVKFMATNEYVSGNTIKAIRPKISVMLFI